MGGGVEMLLHARCLVNGRTSRVITLPESEALPSVGFFAECRTR
jgi:hypothetical protein